MDDIFDTGHSIAAVFDALKGKLGENMPKDIRVATIYYKPTRNKTDRVPDYYLYETDQWVVFPHELEGGSEDFIEAVIGSKNYDLVKRIKAKE